MPLMHGLSVCIHEGDGPPMFLVHGMLASRSQWLLNLEDFSRFSTPITIELLGHHESPAANHAQQYKPDSYVRLFEVIRKDLGFDSIFIGGCSLGAALTMRYTLNHSNRVRAQFFTNSSSAFADQAMSKLWQERSVTGYRSLLSAGQRGIDRMPVHPRRATRLPSEVKQALVEDSKSHSLFGIAATTRWTSPTASIREELANFTVPSMLLCGRYEKRFRPLLEVAKRDMPALVVHELEAGHGVNMEAAEPFNKHVEKLVRTYA